MTGDALHKKLNEIAGEGNALRNEIMSGHTTFRIGGPADHFVRVKDKETLLELVSFLRLNDEPFFVLGNGSNLLVSDRGIRGVVLHMASGLRELEIDPETGDVYAGAGLLLSEVVAACAKESLDGLTFASGIPGTVGGALVMNAGAYGSEMTDVVVSADAIDLDADTPLEITLSHDELGFHYRGSVTERRNLIFTGTRLKLYKGDEKLIRERIEELSKERRSKQPLEYPSAGSTFKRPEGHFAGKLIMDAGLRGYREGDAEVSEKHCGFVVNRGKATAADVRRLMDGVKSKVLDAFGVTLEPEILFVGEFDEG